MVDGTALNFIRESNADQRLAFIAGANWAAWIANNTLPVEVLGDTMNKYYEDLGKELANEHD